MIPGSMLADFLMLCLGVRLRVRSRIKSISESDLWVIPAIYRLNVDQGKKNEIQHHI